MRVRVEIRWNEGDWIARFRKQKGHVGQLTTGSVEVDGTPVVCLQLHRVEPCAGVAQPPPIPLFEPQITEVWDDDFRVAGWEFVDGRKRKQEWDCQVVPPGQVGYT